MSINHSTPDRFYTWWKYQIKVNSAEEKQAIIAPCVLTAQWQQNVDNFPTSHFTAETSYCQQYLWSIWEADEIKLWWGEVRMNETDAVHKPWSVSFVWWSKYGRVKNYGRKLDITEFNYSNDSDTVGLNVFQVGINRWQWLEDKRQLIKKYDSS